MKFDTVIIGGGLSGLTCGVRLQKQGKRCVIVSAGQSALHFSSGSFDLLNRLADGTEVVSPVEQVSGVDKAHPYVKLGDKFAFYAAEAQKLMADCGVELQGSADKNHYHFTPMGTMKPSWLTISDFDCYDNEAPFKGKKVMLLNISGFLDFNTKFIADALETAGASCMIKSISLPELNKLRVSPTEMRSTNIAKVIDKEEVFNKLVSVIIGFSDGFDVVALPAVFGLASDRLVKALKGMVNIKLMPTMPPSVPGIRVQQQLRREFERLGGCYMLGDTVEKAEIENGKVKKVYTTNHGNIGITAEAYVLTTGSFFSNGLVAHSHDIIEPVFGADVDFSEDRADWFDANFFGKQNYLTFGVATDEKFRVKKNGKSLENLYAAGSVLSGFNPIYEGCGAGVAMLTSLFVADNL